MSIICSSSGSVVCLVFIILCFVFLFCLNAFERKRLSAVRKGGITLVIKGILDLRVVINGAVL